MRRAAPLKRHSPLRAEPGKSLKRKPPKHRRAGSGLQWRIDLGPCVVCPAEGVECRGPVQGHHVIAKATLRKAGFAASLDDLRNRLPVCEYRHEQHTTSYKTIPRSVLPAAVFEFAEEVGLTWWITRHYGEGVAA